ncbi:MAG: hypothetical protein M9961_03805 [Ilumatobacteraceae bacterium]|nr:hypothetical protein [Ilumatobacteraceae bacterium]
MVGFLQPFQSWLWLEFVILVVIGTTALALAAHEWSRRGLFALALLLGALAAAFVVRVGHRAEQQDLVTHPVADASEEFEELYKSATADATAANTASRKKFETALAALSESLGYAPTAFQIAGGDVYAALSSDPIDTVDVREAMLHLLTLPVEPEHAPQALSVRDAANAAVAAVPGKEATAPARDAFDAAITELPCAGDHNPCGLAKPLALHIALHHVQLELARYRAAVAPGDAALQAAATALAGEKPEPSEVSIWAAAGAGPSEIIQSITKGTSLRVVPGPVGWLLLGIVAIGLLRWLTRVNSAQMPGPVTIDYTGDDDLKSVLRIAVLKNLATPAASPGAAVAQSVTDLATLANPEAGVVGKFVTALTNAVSASRGYTVEADVLTAPKADSGERAERPAVRVLVRVSSATSKRSLGSATFEHESARKAMQSAGLWAAGFLLARSTRVPSWATWTEATAQALGAANSDHPSLAELEAAARTAPASGWILVLYGNQLELAGRQLDAIEVYARAVAAHPRYRIARYRLAGALGMSSRDGGAAWIGATLARRASVIQWLHQAARRVAVDAVAVDALASAGNFPTNARALSRSMLQTIVDDTHWPRTWAAAMRRSERSSLWIDWWQGGSRSNHDLRWLAKSAMVVYGGGDVQSVERQAAKPDSSWQLSYNLACHYASSSPPVPQRALAALQRCLVRPGAEELTADWVRQDPDLAAVANSPGFDEFCARLAQGATP